MEDTKAESMQREAESAHQTAVEERVRFHPTQPQKRGQKPGEVPNDV